MNQRFLNMMAGASLLGALTLGAMPGLAQTPGEPGAPSGLEAPTVPASDQATLVQQILKQQAIIVENQTKIDQTIASVQELVRQAGIFASRGGGGGASE